MSDNKLQSTGAQGAAAQGATLTDSIPRLRIRFEDVTGKQLIAPLDFRFLPEMSLKIAKMYAIEAIDAPLKRAVGDALAELGFK